MRKAVLIAFMMVPVITAAAFAGAVIEQASVTTKGADTWRLLEGGCTAAFWADVTNDGKPDAYLITSATRTPTADGRDTRPRPITETRSTSSKPEPCYSVRLRGRSI